MSQSTETPAGQETCSEPVLELLGDEYARDILCTLESRSATATELVDVCDGSQVTIYRRLNSLEEAGFIRSSSTITSDGTHCKTYHSDVDSVFVTVTSAGFDVMVRSNDVSSTHRLSSS